MQINFDTSRDSRMDALGLVALLAAVYGLSAKDAPPGPLVSAPSSAAAAASTSAPAESSAGAAGQASDTTTDATQDDASGDAADPSTLATRVDKNGLLWDGRIHSTPAFMTKEMVWRKKRGLNDAALIKTVEAELRARVGAVPVATSAAQPAPPPPAITAQPAAAAPPPPATTSAPPAAAAPASDDPCSSFAAFSNWLTPLCNAKKLSYKTAIDVIKAHGMNSMAELRGKGPDEITPVFMDLQGHIEP